MLDCRSKTNSLAGRNMYNVLSILSDDHSTWITVSNYLTLGISLKTNYFFSWSKRQVIELDCRFYNHNNNHITLRSSMSFHTGELNSSSRVGVNSDGFICYSWKFDDYPAYEPRSDYSELCRYATQSIEELWLQNKLKLELTRANKDNERDLSTACTWVEACWSICSLASRGLAQVLPIWWIIGVLQ